MRLRHATLARNLVSILRDGLLCRKSEGKRKVCWVCRPSLTWWACIHTVKRHGGRIESTVVLDVNVPRSWLRKHGNGLWYSVRDIPPTRISVVHTFGEIAG